MKTVIRVLNLCARFLKPLKILLIIFTLFALLLTAYCLLASSGLALELLEPAIVATLWGMLVLACIELFQELPAPVLAKDPFLRRLSARIKLLLFSLLALITVLVFALLIWLSMRLLFL
ncbi:MAG: hypothetical protein CMP91_02150 [Gammaproteobacteria bacterium]|nr:hypothetical protein [Gammaproteobacteria bacterium]MAY03259.1 hypothetical protein [Gammaproteobacteria bacterium]